MKSTFPYLIKHRNSRSIQPSLHSEPSNETARSQHQAIQVAQNDKHNLEMNHAKSTSAAEQIERRHWPWSHRYSYRRLLKAKYLRSKMLRQLRLVFKLMIDSCSLFDP